MKAVYHEMCGDARLKDLCDGDEELIELVQNDEMWEKAAITNKIFGMFFEGPFLRIASLPEVSTGIAYLRSPVICYFAKFDKMVKIRQNGRNSTKWSKFDKMVEFNFF